MSESFPCLRSVGQKVLCYVSPGLLYFSGWTTIIHPSDLKPGNVTNRCNFGARPVRDPKDCSRVRAPEMELLYTLPSIFRVK